MIRISCLIAVAASIAWTTSLAQQPAPDSKITIDWTAGRIPLKTTPTLQVVVNPPLRRGSPIHDAAFNNLKEIGADYVRYVPWLPYPRLAVAELAPPTKDKTSWDFTLIDPMTIDFLNATEGHSRILNFSTIPAWLYSTARPVLLPADPDKPIWNYTQGKELRDPSGKELAAYYTRLVSWYTRGGFTDELGIQHTSNEHYKIPYWEVFNEIDLEHNPTPQQYVTSYDAIVGSLHQLDPSMKFVGLALAFPETHPEMVEYFLNPRNHAPGIPLDMISYHFYATPTKEETPDHWQYTFFDQADRILATIRYVEAIRKRLSPTTQTTLDEIGSILPVDWPPDTPEAQHPHIPAIYWNASAALYTYVFLESAKLGIDVVGESQLVGYPSQFPSVTMLDWTTGAPNARFEVLRLLHDHIHPGATLVQTHFTGKDVDALAFEDPTGRHLLLVNKRNRTLSIALPTEFTKAATWTIDQQHPKATKPSWPTQDVNLAPFAVAILDAP
jgi:hypothetical protein